MALLGNFSNVKKAFVNSLPKSGTNLLAKCLTLFGYKERGHISAGCVLDRRLGSIIRRILWRPDENNYLVGINSPVAVRKSAIDSILGKIKEGEFLTAHVGYRDDFLSSVIKHGFVPIQVIRDPRAVLASFVPYVMKDQSHFLHNSFKSLSVYDRYKGVLEGISLNGSTLASLRTCCLSLDPWVNSKDVLCIKFEDMVGAMGGGSNDKMIHALELLANRLELPLDSISQVAENLYGPGRHTFRKGKVDSWKEEIPAALQSEVARQIGDILEKWGYVN